ncbi:MAG: DinB family protein [Chloroflexota bacterium]|nr:DinB family protein [Chloroflexota bacterium]
MTEQTRDSDTILPSYADGPSQLEVAIAGLTDTELDLAQDADTWTIRQIVHHIVDGDDLWKVCIKAALGNHSGIFSLQWYWDIPQDTWVESWGYAGRSIEPSLALFHANRRHVVQLIRQIPDAWEQHMLVRWPNKQEEQVTVGSVIEMQVHHVTHHINDIRGVRQTHNL